MTHPSVEQLAAWIDRGLPREEWREVLRHLIACHECRAVVISVLNDLEAVPVRGQSRKIWEGESVNE